MKFNELLFKNKTYKQAFSFIKEGWFDWIGGAPLKRSKDSLIKYVQFSIENEIVRLTAYEEEHVFYPVSQKNVVSRRSELKLSGPTSVFNDAFEKSQLIDGKYTVVIELSNTESNNQNVSGQLYSFFSNLISSPKTYLLTLTLENEQDIQKVELSEKKQSNVLSINPTV